MNFCHVCGASIGSGPHCSQCKEMLVQAAKERSITDRLCTELRARADRGVQKYGVTLDAAKLTPEQILQHAKEEALDLAAYLQKQIDALQARAA